MNTQRLGPYPLPMHLPSPFRARRPAAIAGRHTGMLCIHLSHVFLVLLVTGGVWAGPAQEKKAMSTHDIVAAVNATTKAPLLSRLASSYDLTLRVFDGVGLWSSLESPGQEYEVNCFSNLVLGITIQVARLSKETGLIQTNFAGPLPFGLHASDLPEDTISKLGSPSYEESPVQRVVSRVLWYDRPDGLKLGISFIRKPQMWSIRLTNPMHVSKAELSLKADGKTRSGPTETEQIENSPEAADRPPLLLPCPQSRRGVDSTHGGIHNSIRFTPKRTCIRKRTMGSSATTGLTILQSGVGAVGE